MWQGCGYSAPYMGVLRMIKFPDGELRDYLPAAMKNDVDMVCLSHAVKRATERLIQYQNGIMVYHFIDRVPEPVLDLLAVELRSPYYSDSMPADKKRGIVKNTLRWHAQAGTPGAVAEMIGVVFGGGEVIEWPDFEDPPYTPGTFDIKTDAQLTPETLDYLALVIDRVKNVRSHLRKILVHREAGLKVYTGAGIQAKYRPPAVIDGYQETGQAGQDVYAGAACSAAGYRPEAVVDGYRVYGDAACSQYAGIGHSMLVYQPAVRECGASWQP